MVLSTSLFSSIREHSHKTGHVFNEHDFRIIDMTRNKYDLGILEYLVITNTRPKLNIMLNSNELCLFWKYLSRNILIDTSFWQLDFTWA